MVLQLFQQQLFCNDDNGANHLEHIDHSLAVDTIFGRVKGAIHVRSGIVVE